MTRVKRGHIRRKRRQRKFKIVKGTASSILLKKANQQYLKAYQNAFIDRRLRKRYFRSIWICRINAKIRQFGFNYHSLSQKFKGGLGQALSPIGEPALGPAACRFPRWACPSGSQRKAIAPDLSEVFLLHW